MVFTERSAFTASHGKFSAPHAKNAVFLGAQSYTWEHARIDRVAISRALVERGYLVDH